MPTKLMSSKTFVKINLNWGNSNTEMEEQTGGNVGDFLALSKVKYVTLYHITPVSYTS
jgi:hypothetical protein